MNEPKTDAPNNDALKIDLKVSSAHSGVQWSYESDDLDLTLLHWRGHKGGVAAHVNAEVDVVLIVIEGAGIVTVNGNAYRLESGHAVLVPKGSTREIAPVGEEFRYLSVHRRRRGLMPTMGGKPIVR